MQVLIICMIGPHKNDSTLTGFMPNGQYGSVFSQLKGIIIMGAYDFFLKQTAKLPTYHLGLQLCDGPLYSPHTSTPVAEG